VLIPSKNEFLINVSDVPAYKAVLLNYEDQDFVQVRLDKESYSFFKKNLNSIEDKLTRAILIRTFFDSLLIGETSNKEWNDIVCEFIISESNVSYFYFWYFFDFFRNKCIHMYSSWLWKL
jgi:hypothetical protein